jgi:menaquinol-cytochrome c reductase iron-sulfur subunit
MDRPGDEVANPDGARVEPSITRKGFLAWMGGLAAGAVAAILGVLGLTPVVASASRDESAAWTPVGKVDSSEPGQPDLSVAGTVVPTTFTRTVTDAYLPPEDQKTPVFLVCEGGGAFTVFDARCTHLGCPLSWSSTSCEFLCACHGGVYNEHGKVTDGPPPRPLDHYDVKVENGVLYVGRLREGES